MTLFQTHLESNIRTLSRGTREKSLARDRVCCRPFEAPWPGAEGCLSSKNEFARRGTALYKKLRTDLPPGNDDDFIAIDIETGEYEIHANELTAAARLRKRVADPQIWLVNLGTGMLDRFGGHKTGDAV